MRVEIACLCEPTFYTRVVTSRQVSGPAEEREKSTGPESARETTKMLDGLRKLRRSGCDSIDVTFQRWRLRNVKHPSGGLPFLRSFVDEGFAESDTFSTAK